MSKIPFRAIRSLFSRDLAIDLGTSNTVAYAKWRGIVVSEPSVVAINRATKRIEAVGKKAIEALNKNTELMATKPMAYGVINDIDLVAKLLQHIIRKAHKGRRWVSPRVIIGVHSEITEIERYALEESVYQAGASEVYLVEDVRLAAIGAGLPIAEPHGNMIVDIGGGTTDIAVISLSGIVYSRAVRVAGNEMDEAITQYIKRKYNLLIGERTAEAIKIELGSAFPLDDPLAMDVRGRDRIEDTPRTITITDEEVREALADSVSTIVNAVRIVLERIPPDLSSDLVERGITLTGGVAMLKNLDKRLSIETNLPIGLAEMPMLSTVLGAGHLLSDFNLLRRLNLEGKKVYLTKHDLNFNVAYYSLYMVLGISFTSILLRYWFDLSKPTSSGLGFFIVSLGAYPFFTQGMRMRRARRESESRWTLPKWTGWSFVMGCIGYLLGHIFI